jgi:pyruvate formate lyase activating enzyme
MREIRKDCVFFDESGGGVSFSGGEPLSQPEFLAAALDACAAEGIHRVVDTSGFAPTDVVQRIAPKVDLFLFDLKVVDDLRHQESIGVSNQLILENLRVLASLRASVMVRIPIVPGFNDDKVNIDDAVNLLAGLGLRDVALLPYHEIGTDKYSRLGREYPLANVASPSAAHMEEIAERFRYDGFAVSIGG